jgi:hypothetical protein
MNALYDERSKRAIVGLTGEEVSEAVQAAHGKLS